MVRPSTGTQLGETLGPVFEAREKRLRLIDQINSKLKVTDAIIREIARTLYQPLSARQQVMNQLSSVMAEPVPRKGVDFGRWYIEDTEKWAKLAKEGTVKISD
jgi:hypothetical protein